MLRPGCLLLLLCLSSSAADDAGWDQGLRVQLSELEQSLDELEKRARGAGKDAERKALNEIQDIKLRRIELDQRVKRADEIGRERWERGRGELSDETQALKRRIEKVRLELRR
ncbi:MAG: hypothetical protein HY549_05185 [Elusimicrobia bacterium]|nr:hypothetical protein [Elusimicrobiota bacterium]